MKYLIRSIPAMAFAALLAIGACTPEEKKAEQITATETSDQMEEAKMLGRKAAKDIVNKDFSDTMALQKAILNARSINSKYDINKDRKAREAFDSAFYSTIRTVRPELADQLKRD